MAPCWPAPGGLVRTGPPEEAQECRGDLVRRLFGLVMPGMDRAAAQLPGHPGPPDGLGIAVDVQVVVGRDEQQHRALDLPACGPVGFLVSAVDPQAGPVVLAHAMDDSRVTEG